MALFALLLLLLGAVLAREILAEVESRVENEQRFVLEVAAFSGFALGEDSLRQIRDRAARASQAGGPRTRAEFIVFREPAPPLTTLEPGGPAERLIQALADVVKVRPQLHTADGVIRRDTAELDGRRWLVLFTSRPARGPGAASEGRRQFYLLYPFAEIEQAKNRALLRIVGLGAAGLLCAAVLGLVLAHWIAGPVRRLASAAKRISTGGLNEPLEPPPAHADEIGELTRAFQTMVESLRASQAELLKAERLAVTGKLAASVAHEIRNPLTSLRMTMELLQQRAAHTDAPTQEAYRIVLNEIDRLSLAVEELLTFARPRPPRRVPSDLNKLVTETLHLLERQLAHAKVQAVPELDPGMPPALAFDPHKVRQLLVNLILNAQQAIIRDGSLSVRTRWDAGSRQAVLSVEDNGPGLAPEVRAKLFDPFVSTKPDGGGLGLAIAKQVAEEHGGSISCESVPGKTVFTVVLPTGKIVKN
jgi:signal transduction histidine kinase